MQDNEQRIPCSTIALVEEAVGSGANMENLHSHSLRSRVDNEMLTPISAGEPLGVGIVDREPSLHSKSLYSHSQCYKLNHQATYPQDNLVDPRSREQSIVFNPTHYGRPPG